MKNCRNCIHSFTRDICWFCGISGTEITFPMFRGGSKKCECYKKGVRERNKMIYLKKDEMYRKGNNYDIIKILQFRNDFTDRLDNFINKDWKETANKIYDGHITYLWKQDVERFIERGDSHIAFRTPGATRGHIEVDNTGFITKVRFYQPDANKVYEGDYEKVLADEFVGHRFDTKERNYYE